MIRTIALLALALFLIFEGLLTLFGLHFEGENTVLGLLALIAGALLLVSVAWSWNDKPVV